MNANNLLGYLFVAITALLSSSEPLFAQPVSTGVLDDVVIIQTDGGYIIESLFTCPVRYITHFPRAEGDEINIRIDPVPLCDPNSSAGSGRGSISPRSETKNSLYEVVYDGEILGGPFLTLFFNESVKFRVSQGEDYRSIVVDVHE